MKSQAAAVITAIILSIGCCATVGHPLDTSLVAGVNSQSDAVRLFGKPNTVTNSNDVITYMWVYARAVTAPIPFGMSASRTQSCCVMISFNPDGTVLRRTFSDHNQDMDTLPRPGAPVRTYEQ